MQLFEPNYINVEFVFNWIFRVLGYFLSLVWLDPILAWLFAYRYVLALPVVVLATATIFLFTRLYRLRHEEAIKLATAAIAVGRTDETRVNKEWERVLKYLNSDNSADWKIAVLEADKILDALVKKMGYDGETLGERLKVVEPSDFLTLPQAWEAHRLRNRLAHEADFQMTLRDARRALALYEQVFREFDYI